jgi:hypothetical protein
MLTVPVCVKAGGRFHYVYFTSESPPLTDVSQCALCCSELACHFGCVVVQQACGVDAVCPARLFPLCRKDYRCDTVNGNRSNPGTSLAITLLPS